MTKRLLFLLFAVVAFAVATAQNIVTGVVKDAETGEELPYVNLRVARSSNAKTAVQTIATDESGRFTIKGLRDGTYQVVFTFVGYKTTTLPFTLSKAQPRVDLGSVALETSTSALGEATVTAERSTMKLEVDRKTYNIGADLASLGASASEALENIPSVEVDQEGNISMRGSSSVEVWINGKPSGLTADNRAMILQQIPAETIDRIEVIDNPSAKYSAEGSAGIINIVLKQDRRAGYYGSLQAGGNTAGGANASGNINYNSKWFDVNATLGYRHRQDNSGSIVEQEFLSRDAANGYAMGQPISYQNSESETENRGNNIFARGGLTFHASKKDDLTLSGNLMRGRGTESGETPYYYGTILPNGNQMLDRILTRSTDAKRPMRMLQGEFDYRHTFSDKHYLDFNLSYNQWKSDMENVYADRTDYYANGAIDNDQPALRAYQHRVQNIKNHRWAAKLDYENTLNEHWQIQAGYNGDFSRENTPQYSYDDTETYDGTHEKVDEGFYNRFKYDMDTHALYAQTTMKYGKWGMMAGLRGEYWSVNTQSFTYWQEGKHATPEHLVEDAPIPYKKDFFQLFPSLFLSYQITENDQLQLNYTRRLRRPWGGELNTFMDTRSATNLNFGNPELTPEYSNSFSLNYLRTMAGGRHSLLLSAYYRPTTDVMQRLSYRLPADAVDSEGNLINESRLLSTSQNITKSTNTGGELTLKNKVGQWLDLNTTAAAYYYHIDSFDYEIIDPLYHQPVHVSGNVESRFTWNIRMQANVRLPYDWSIQATGNYRSREAISQGYRNPSYGLDMGIRKQFLNKKLMLALNCRDVLDSRRWTQNAFTDTFTQHGEFWRHSRKVGITLTWNFGNMQRKMRPDMNRQQQVGGEDSYDNSGYGMDMGE